MKRVALQSKVTSLPLSDLVEDKTLYPRHHLDGANLAGLVRSLQTGAKFPPIVADLASKVITDGVHRAHAHRKVFGGDASVSVELVKYPNRAEMLIDAVRRNTAHGQRLSTIDQARAAIMLRDVRVNVKTISALLHAPDEYVETLIARVAISAEPSKYAVPGTMQVVLKQSTIHERGNTLTKPQVVANASMPGGHMLVIVRQLTKAIEAKLIDTADERLMVELSELYELLGTLLLH